MVIYLAGHSNRHWYGTIYSKKVGKTGRLWREDREITPATSPMKAGMAYGGHQKMLLTRLLSNVKDLLL
jgi:hypothetical protein